MRARNPFAPDRFLARIKAAQRTDHERCDYRLRGPSGRLPISDLSVVHPLVLPTLAGTYSATLVAVSVIVAALASYVALVLASRVIAASGDVRRAWLLAGAVAMGTGIWAMHFVGMLAFRLDDRPITYDAVHLILSVLVAIAASGFALWVMSLRTNIPQPRDLSAGAPRSGEHVSAIGVRTIRRACRFGGQLRAEDLS
jgi:hypothetical protein